jgi:hypothetical protein
MVAFGVNILRASAVPLAQTISNTFLRRVLLLTNKTEATTVTSNSDLNETRTATPELAQAGKKGFIEPEITVPVDILEATTFFQTASSGATN